MGQSAELIDSIAGLLGVLVWPAVILFVLLRFRVPIGKFFTDLGEFTLKAGGIEATGRRREVEAAASFGAATVKDPQGKVGDPSSVAAALTSAFPSTRSRRQLDGVRVLWVNDRPETITYERQAFEALGLRFTLCLTTDDALAELDGQTFDAVISDMDRPPDARAGFTLLDALRERGDRTPFVLYTSSIPPESVAEVRAHGAVGSTSSPQELISLVSQALGVPSR